MTREQYEKRKRGLEEKLRVGIQLLESAHQAQRGAVAPPHRFTRGDICAALGYEPDRGSLYRILKDLAKKGSVSIESVGSGRRATIYCNPGAPDRATNE